ncbi:related to multidrug resistant protein [Ramularia collo-cygni]|uniref:Related to multidrug resistant protein n=1 Tax=Ramularia collo-cygni TaxID=112498 RepID=A0A2D3UZK8_9PEZI|nr:related to multidrug resistant protein [Ramularia collo-cygni]CZT15634.1 related to multidrug resistant protein [Ramularia collo-cygni]
MDDSSAGKTVQDRDQAQVDNDTLAPKYARKSLRRSFQLSLTLDAFADNALQALREVRTPEPFILGSQEDASSESTERIHRIKAADSDGSEVEKRASQASQQQDEAWDHDQANPQNWPVRKKWRVVLVASWISFITPLASTMVSPALPEIAQGLRIESHKITALIVSLDILGFAVSGVLSAPLSEMYGRRPLYNLSTVCFAALTLGCGFAPNIAVLLALRFIHGALGTACMVIGGATCADVFDPMQRAQAVAVWASVILLGPNVGPIIGGIVVQAKGWRWIFYIFAMAGAVNVVLSLLLMPETAAVVLKQRRIARLKADIDTADRSSRNGTSLRALARPLKLLFFSPVVLIMAIYSAITHAVVYLLFTSIPFTFSPQYHFSPRTTGLTYLAPGLGMMFGAFAGGFLSGRTAKLTMADGTHSPEKRLDSAITVPGSLCMVAGLLLYGWSVNFHIHYMSALAGLLMYGFGLAFTGTCAQTYVVECHLEHSASVTAAFTVLTSILSGILPMTGLEIFSSLGMGWGNVLLAGVVAISSSAFLICRTKGAYLRDRYRVRL